MPKNNSNLRKKLWHKPPTNFALCPWTWPVDMLRQRRISGKGCFADLVLWDRRLLWTRSSSSSSEGTSEARDCPLMAHRTLGPPGQKMLWLPGLSGPDHTEAPAGCEENLNPGGPRWTTAKLWGGLAQCHAPQTQPVSSNFTEWTTSCDGCQQDDRGCSPCGAATSWQRRSFSETGGKEADDSWTCNGAFSQELRTSTLAVRTDGNIASRYWTASGYEYCGRRSRRAQGGSIPGPGSAGWLTLRRSAPRTQTHLPVPNGRLVGQLARETVSTSPCYCDPVGQCSGSRAFVCVACWCWRSHCSVTSICTALWLTMSQDAFGWCQPAHRSSFESTAEVSSPHPFFGSRPSVALDPSRSVVVLVNLPVLFVPCFTCPGARFPRVCIRHPSFSGCWTRVLLCPGARLPKASSFSSPALVLSPECSTLSSHAPRCPTLQGCCESA